MKKNRDLGRREFILGGAALFLSSCAPSKAVVSYSDKVISLLNENPSKNKAHEKVRPVEIDKKTKEKIDKTKELIGEYEYEFFIDFFLLEYDTYGYNEILGKINDIQKENALKTDGIIGERTLKVLYENYYAKNIEKLDYETALRLEIYNEMSKYKNKIRNHPKHGKLKASSIPRVFSDKYYHGNLGTLNLYGSFIDKSLYNKVPKKIDKTGNNAYLKEIDGKFVVSLYIDGKLVLASYSSPGNPRLKLAKSTTEGNFESIFKKYSYKDMYHISGADASVKNGKGAIMPYAVHVTGGIFAHAGNVNGEKLSHGCIRLPLLYAKGLYEFFMEYGDINWNIQDTK